MRVFDPNVYAKRSAICPFFVCELYFEKCVYSSIAGGPNDTTTMNISEWKIDLTQILKVSENSTSVMINSR